MLETGSGFPCYNDGIQVKPSGSTIIMDQNNVTAPGTCSCKCHKVKPILIVLLGVTFLLQSLGYLSWGTVNVIWPILIIIAGFSKMCRCCKK